MYIIHLSKLSIKIGKVFLCFLLNILSAWCIVMYLCMWSFVNFTWWLIKWWPIYQIRHIHYTSTTTYTPFIPCKIVHSLNCKRTIFKETPHIDGELFTMTCSVCNEAFILLIVLPKLRSHTSQLEYLCIDLSIYLYMYMYVCMYVHFPSLVWWLARNTNYYYNTIIPIISNYVKLNSPFTLAVAIGNAEPNDLLQVWIFINDSI